MRQRYCYGNICALLLLSIAVILAPSFVWAQQDDDIATTDTEASNNQTDVDADVKNPAQEDATNADTDVDARIDGDSEVSTDESSLDGTEDSTTENDAVSDSDLESQNDVPAATIADETLKIIAEANHLLAEELNEIRDDIRQLENISKQLKQALQQDLSEEELKTLRKKQSKDVANIILRFQDRIDFIEQQTVEFTGQMEQATVNLDKLASTQQKILATQQNIVAKQDEYNDIIGSDTEQQNQLLELIARQNKSLQSQGAIIKKHARAIRRLEKNNNTLVKQIQKLANQ